CGNGGAPLGAGSVPGRHPEPRETTARPTRTVPTATTTTATIPTMRFNDALTPLADQSCGATVQGRRRGSVSWATMIRPGMTRAEMTTARVAVPSVEGLRCGMALLFATGPRPTRCPHRISTAPTWVGRGVVDT